MTANADVFHYNLYEGIYNIGCPDIQYFDSNHSYDLLFVDIASICICAFTNIAKLITLTDIVITRQSISYYSFVV